MNILIIEDDPKILNFLKKGLKEEGFTVDSAIDGEDGLYLLSVNKYDIAIIDWYLPGISGMEICKKARSGSIFTPILMLTAKSEIEDKVSALNSGADDYMTKPFSFSELIARINSLTRRTSYQNKDIIKIDTLEIDLFKRIVKRSGNVIELTNREFNLLVYMAENQGSIVTNTKIQEKIWGASEFVSSNVLNVFIYHLRKKIDTKGESPLILTVRNSGYKINKR